MVLTTLGGYSMAPGPFDLQVLLWTTTGTALCSAAANSFNQASVMAWTRKVCGHFKLCALICSGLRCLMTPRWHALETEF